jgi:hypothetical protein
LKKQKIKLSLNEPENPNDRVQARVNFWGKDLDFWMQEAEKFWKKHFPEVERLGPLNYIRFAIPHTDKKVVQSFLDLIKNGPEFTMIIEEAKSDFTMFDWEVYDDKIVFKACICHMYEDYELESPFVLLKALSTNIPDEILETLRK